MLVVKYLQCKNEMIAQKCKINVSSHKFSFGSRFKQNKNGEMLC